MLKPEKNNKHRGNFAEGAKFSVPAAGKYLFTSNYDIIIFFNAKGGKRLDKHKGNFAEGAKFLVPAASKY